MLTQTINVIFTLVALSGVLLTVKLFPFPQKFTWVLSFFIFFVYGLLHSLYEFGGRFIVLFPALYIITTVVQTTGILALCISIYSHLNDNNISAHWYSIPTGASPISMASQYVPGHLIQVAIVSIAVTFFGLKHFEKGKFFIVGLILFAVSHFVGTKLDGFQNIMMIAGMMIILFRLKKKLKLW
eukprot:gene8598-423_t